MSTNVEMIVAAVEADVTAVEVAMAALASSPEYMELLEVHNELRNALLSAKDHYGNYKHSTREVQTLLERYRDATIAHHTVNVGSEVPAVVKVIAAEPVKTCTYPVYDLKVEKFPHMRPCGESHDQSTHDAGDGR